MLLWRPVGLHELELIRASGFRAFPPRLAHQPIFYPVLNRAYAEQIASEWNVQDEPSGFAGFVLRFGIEDAFVARYPVQTVGSRDHQELWVPADELEAFNQHLLGTIEMVSAFFGPKFQGERDLGFFARSPQTSMDRWSLWRQDDHGNRFEVSRDQAREEVERLKGEFEARGHKQVYWVEPTRS